MGNGQVQTYTRGGVLDDYYASQPQLGASNDYDSLGSCGLCDSALYGDDHHRGQFLWYDNGGVYNTYSFGRTRYPYLTVDGDQAFSPAQGSVHGSATNPPVLTSTHTIDPATGDMVLTEHDPLSVCSDAGTGTACPAYVASGLELDRRITQGEDGRVVRISDEITSSDGAAHTYAIAYDEYERSTSHNGFRFPGEPAFAAHVDGDSVSGGAGPTETVEAIEDMTAAPSVANPAGTITTSPAPDGYRFGGTDGFEMLFAGSVPAGGSRTIRQSFALAASQSELDGYQTANLDELAAPAVAITSPVADGTTVGSASLQVAGTASDNVGVSSLTIDGDATPVAAGGSARTVTLSPGANTITAVARDAAGNSTTATRTVTYTPAPTPPHAATTPVRATAVTLGRTLRQGIITVFTPLSCVAAPGVHCVGKVVLRTRIRVVSTIGGKKVTRLRTITVGTRPYRALVDQRTFAYPVRLTRLGRALLRKHRRLTLTLSVFQGTAAVVFTRTLVFTLKARPTT